MLHWDIRLMNAFYNGNQYSVFSLYTLNSCKSIGFIRRANRHTDIYKRSMKRCTVYIVTIFIFLISAWLVLTIFTCVGLFKSGELAKSFEQWLVYTVNTFKNRSTFQTISIAFVNLLLLLIKWQKKQNLQF